MDGCIQRLNKMLYTGIDDENLHIHNQEDLTFKMTYYDASDISDLTSQVKIYIE